MGLPSPRWPPLTRQTGGGFHTPLMAPAAEVWWVWLWGIYPSLIDQFSMIGQFSIWSIWGRLENCHFDAVWFYREHRGNLQVSSGFMDAWFSDRQTLILGIGRRTDSSKIELDQHPQSHVRHEHGHKHLRLNYWHDTNACLSHCLRNVMELHV